VSKRTTAKKRRRRALKAVWQGCRTQRHDPLREQDRRRSQKLPGHDQDDGLRGHDRKLAVRYPMAATAWRYGLSRRSQPRAIRWEKFCKLWEVDPLPTPRLVHGLSPGRQGRNVLRPSRADALAPEAPDACIAPVRLCGEPGRVTAGPTRQATAYSIRVAPAFSRA
jgi:hypothetical protein